MEEELARVFTQNGFSFENEDSKKQCLELCTSFDMKPGELVLSWEIFYLNSHLENNKVLSSHIDKFRGFLQSQQRSAFARDHGALHLYSANDEDLLQTEMEVDKTPAEATQAKTFIKPQSEVQAPRLSESGPTPFSQRTNKRSVQLVFNEKLIDPGAPTGDQMEITQDIRRCHVDNLSSGPKPGSRYMADQLESRYNELERRMKNFAKAFSEFEPQPLSQHVAYAFQEKAFVVGRICHDSDENDSDVVLLEGCVEFSGGHRVRLDLHEISQFSLFPGQVLVVEGQNPSGHCLVASRVFDSIPLPSYSLVSREAPPSKKSRVSNLALSETPESKTVLVASGPFTTNDNLLFEPLGEFLSYARSKRPNVLLLMGPFIGAEHPLVKNGMVDKLPIHVFQDKVITLIEEYCNELSNAAVIFVPSTRDPFHDRFFPQPAYEPSMFEDPAQQITLLPNPGVCSIDEIAIGCCTTDVLRHLSSEEISRVPAGASSNRMARLGAHLIGQRSFYPLFPPAPGTNLDVSLAPEALDLPFTPDILILPSDLVPFVKPSNYSPGIRLEQTQNSENCSTLIVNPGRITKGVAGGTFAELLVVPGEQPDSSSGLFGIPGRTKVTLIRI